MKRFYLDASVFITLVRIGHAGLVGGLDGDVFVPEAVVSELYSFEDVESQGTNPELARLNQLTESGVIGKGPPDDLSIGRTDEAILGTAARHLGRPDPAESEITGDVALLALGLVDDDGVVVTDDKPLRKTCKTLQVPVSGSISVLMAAVKRGELGADGAKNALVAMDEVGARLSARLLRRAERLIDEVTEEQ